MNVIKLMKDTLIDGYKIHLWINQKKGTFITVKYKPYISYNIHGDKYLLAIDDNFWKHTFIIMEPVNLFFGVKINRKDAPEFLQNIYYKLYPKEK